MNALKKAVVTPPVYFLPISNGHMTLDTDTCNKTSLVCHAKKGGGRDKTVYRILVPVTHQCRKEIQHLTNRMFGHSLVRTDITPLSRRNTVYNPDRSWPFQMYPEPNRQYQADRATAPSFFGKRLWRSPLSWSKKSNRWRGIPATDNGVDKTHLDDVLLVRAIPSKKILS